MSDQSIIIRNDAALTVTFSPVAHEQKAAALALSAVIGKVTNADENASAVQAQGALVALRNLIEKARKAAKEPILEYGRRLDAAAKAFAAELDEELTRLAPMLGDFQQLERTKSNASALAHNEELNAVERDRMAARALAKSHDELDAIDEHYARKAEAVAPPLAPERADGQVVRQDYDVQVTDIWLLARSHPGCVKIEPRISEIKELLKAGVKVAGVKATPITKSSVRANSKQAVEI